MDGGLHHVINRRIGGGYYLTVFNHAGIERTVECGEIQLQEAKTTVEIRFNPDFEVCRLCYLEGDGLLTQENGVYLVTIPAGGWMFFSF